MILLRLISVPDRKFIGMIADGMTVDFVPDRTIEVVSVADAARYEIVTDGKSHTEKAKPIHILGDDVAWKPAPGPHTIVVKAIDGAGKAIESRSVTIDAAAPAPPPALPDSSEINLDGADGRGVIWCKAGAEYFLTKPKKLTGGTVKKTGVGPDPIIYYRGTALDSGAFQIDHGQSGTIEDVTIFGPPKTYAVSISGNAIVRRMKFGGRAGGVKIEGAQVVTLDSIVQLDTSHDWFFYSGPKRFETPTTYSERWTRHLTIVNCDFGKGSAYAGGRLHGLYFLYVKKSIWRDTEDQSARYVDPKTDEPKVAVHNGAFRLHYVEKATIEDTLIDGYAAWIGPLDKGDGGMNLPPGQKRDVTLAHRLKLANFVRCRFRVKEFVASAGVEAANFLNCEITGKFSSIITCRYPYLLKDGKDSGRPRPGVNLAHCELSTSAPASSAKVFGGTSPTATQRCSAKECMLNGKPVAEIVAK